MENATLDEVTTARDALTNGQVATNYDNLTSFTSGNYPDVFYMDDQSINYEFFFVNGAKIEFDAPFAANGALPYASDR